jgi:hypothetical protein
MIKNYIILFGCIMLTIFTLPLFAKEITIRVMTRDSTAAAIGFTVNGKESGGAGKLYTGNGPSNQKYSFGFRKTSVNGKNIRCGSLTLNKNSTIVLVKKGNRCHSAISQ